MSKLRCDICGGQIEMQPDKRGLCLNCGTSYSLATMKEMFSGVKVSVTGSSEDVEQWRQLLNRYYPAGDFAEAERIAKKILEAAPSDEQANMIYDELQILKYFEIVNGVVKNYSGTASKISLPNVITHIEARTFADNDYIEEVVLPPNLTVIEDSLFAGCRNLKRVKLPMRLEIIGKCAFKDCYSLVRVTPYDSWDDDSDRRIVLPQSLRRLEGSAFCGCMLEHLILPQNCTDVTWTEYFEERNALEEIPCHINWDGGEAHWIPREAESYKFTKPANGHWQCEQSAGTYDLILTTKDEYSSWIAKRKGTIKQKIDELEEHDLERERARNGRCLFCGGSFHGFLTIKCKNCGKEKNYNWNDRLCQWEAKFYRSGKEIKKYY